MTPLKTLLLTLCIALCALPLRAEEPGRTDGPESSEYGSGGYPFGGPSGRLYIAPAFGSGFFSSAASGAQSGLLYGLDLGYEIDGWIGIHGSYAYLTDRKLSIAGVGSRFAATMEPFVYSASLQAGLYAPKNGTRNFGLAPGAGIDIILTDRLRIGLDYKHDFIFTDNRTTDIDRISAGLKFYF